MSIEISFKLIILLTSPIIHIQNHSTWPKWTQEGQFFTKEGTKIYWNTRVSKREWSKNKRKYWSMALFTK